MAKITTLPQKTSRKKKIWLSVIAGIMIVALGLWAWNQFTPRPLGERLEYLGKEDYGNIFGFDSFPYSTYYYGTDMNIDEIDGYFSKASRRDSPTTETWREVFDLETDDGGSTYFYFYLDSVDKFKKEHPNLNFSTEKKMILTLPDSSYSAAKNAL